MKGEKNTRLVQFNSKLSFLTVHHYPVFILDEYLK